jgi:hypothetical protein
MTRRQLFVREPEARILVVGQIVVMVMVSNTTEAVLKGATMVAGMELERPCLTLSLHGFARNRVRKRILGVTKRLHMVTKPSTFDERRIRKWPRAVNQTAGVHAWLRKVRLS